MANRPGGGIVIVGISERNHVLCPEGLTDEQMATWRYEDIADGINKHADPPISFGYQPCEWGGKKFLILHIHEFTDVPIICKKEYRDDSNQQLPLEKREKVLKKGFLYARSPNKPETKEIDSVESMRTVLNPAIDKGIGRFVKQLQIASIPSEEKKQEERKLRLQALLADHRGFLDDRLDSFVGREAELAQIRQRIAEMMSTGGYVTITGQAGQGKSSVIAKLVKEYGKEQVAYHFIPFNPGPDHQVGLLRNLMARFVLRYNLTDLYVASESRPALRDYFPKVLAEVVAQGGHEVIFLDGLDQLEEDMNGVRDLSFLPTNPPPGIVFVLGTRPNDTLKPLELLKHDLEYPLPGLSRQDFDRLLNRRGVSLDPQMADQFHQKLQANALYLDLVAQELQEYETIPLQEMISRLTHNPANLFSFAIERLSRHQKEWKKVIRPVLGVLLVAREPLTFDTLRHILHLEPDSLRKALTRLGGLIADIRQLGEQRYTLFHLKFRDYLKQDKQNPEKEYIFANDEEEHWHEIIAVWCEQGQLSHIWQETNDSIEQGRREYARWHYAAHLYYGRQWQRLFDLLDEGSYGHAKEHYDVSTRSYVQDLDFGRQAAARHGETIEEELALLPQLWRFTLLRGSLKSRADQYPLELFQVMLLLGRETEVMGLAELLTNPVYKVQILLQIANHLGRLPTRKSESNQIFFRAREVASSIEDQYEKANAFSELTIALARSEQWEQAQVVAHSIENSNMKARTLSALAIALTQAEHWEHAQIFYTQAQTVATSIEDSNEKAKTLGELAEVLSELATALTKRKQWEQAQAVASSIEDSSEKAKVLRELASALAQEQQWEQAQVVATSIEDSYKKATALSALATALAQAQKWEQAQVVATSIEDSYEKVKALRELAAALAQAEQWELALAVITSIENYNEKARALSILASILAQAQQWEQALAICVQAQAVAISIENLPEKAKALSVLATALTQAQQWERAQILFAQAQTVATSIEDSNEKAEALRELATALTQAQQWEQAQVVVNSINDRKKRAEVLVELATTLAQAQKRKQAHFFCAQAQAVVHSFDDKEKAGVLRELVIALAQAQQWEQAQAVVTSIEASHEKGWALRGLATTLAQTQQWEQAQAVVASMEDSFVKARALRELATTLAQTQQWEQAHVVATSIQDSHEKAWVLRELATALAQAQQWEQAQAIATSIEEAYEKAEALRELATALTQAQQWEQAQILYAQMQAIATFIESSYKKAEALKELAIALAQAQQWEQAQAVVASMEDSREKATALEELTTALSQAQQWEQAQVVATAMEDSKEKATALKGLVAALANAQQWEQAQMVATSIEASSNLFENEKAEALRALVIVLAQAQQWEQAQVVANSIESSSNYFGDEKAEALGELAIVLAQAQQWERALVVVASIEDDDEKAGVLSSLAALIAINEYEVLLHLVQHAWLLAETRAFALRLFPLSLGLISFKHEIGLGLYESFKWVDSFLSKRDKLEY